MLLVAHQDLIARLHLEAIGNVVVGFRGVADEGNLIPRGSYKGSQWITIFIPGSVAPDRIILGIVLCHLFGLMEGVDNRAQHRTRRRPNCAVVQVDLISRNQELLSQLCPVGLLIAIVKFLGGKRRILVAFCCNLGGGESRT